jgi:hypothetical protein
MPEMVALYPMPKGRSAYAAAGKFEGTKNFRSTLSIALHVRSFEMMWESCGLQKHDQNM